MSLCCVSNKMEFSLIIVLVGLVGPGQGTLPKELFKKAYECIKNTAPNTDWLSDSVFIYDYIVNIFYQWDSLNHHDYLQ